MSDDPALDSFLGKLSELIRPLADKVDRQDKELRDLRAELKKPKRFVRDQSGRIIGAEPAVSTLNKIG
jgi:hypothetical protein